MALSALPGAEVIVASDAEQAIEIARSHEPVAIVTDVELPGMDGFELVAQLRRDGRYVKTPILVVSANGEGATPKRAVAAGANAFIPKPFSPAAVRRAVERLIDAQ
jgi:CheY-like chemotaxis protein